jgi:DNA-binding CsgD family transcriptional regulator
MSGVDRSRPRERQIWLLLVRGGPDDQMGRTLRVSPRTVRKVIGDGGIKLNAPPRRAVSYALGARGLP